MHRLVWATVLSIWLAGSATCLGDCCNHCGCQASCSKVCRVVCETKKVTEPVYDCACEEFCIPGKSERCVTHDECGHRRIVYKPTCGEVRTRAKLIKRTETKEVASYRWVVEDLCDHCANSCTSRATATKSGEPTADPFSLEARRSHLGPPAPAAR